VDGKVSLRNIAPTLLDLCGLDAPEWMTGTSLMRAVASAEPALDRARPSTIAGAT
jgi:hypothetical protein